MLYGGGMDCRVCTATGDMWLRMAAGSGGGRGGQIGGAFSQESEHDLAVMVSDFLENGSSGADSLCSSDSDSGLSDLGHLADKISVSLLYNLSVSILILLIKES